MFTKHSVPSRVRMILRLQFDPRKKNRKQTINITKIIFVIQSLPTSTKRFISITNIKLNNRI